MKRKVALYFVSFFLFRFLLATDSVTAQTIAYRRGGYGSSTQSNRGTATVMNTTQPGAISHTTTVSITVQ